MAVFAPKLIGNAAVRSKISKSRMPREWFTQRARLKTHVGVDDALSQGDLFVALARQLGKL